MGTSYGPYVMYILSQLMQKRQAGESVPQAEEAGGPAPAPGSEAGAAGRPESVQNAGPGQAPPAAARPASEPAEQIFAYDETAAVWHRETNLELLKHFCREGYALASRHGHFLIGNNEGGSYIAVPGRFLLEDQPAGGRTGFTLWQPLRGGEELYAGLDDMDEESARRIYGYWIAALDSRTLEISEV